jgi:hypothetical protein
MNKESLLVAAQGTMKYQMSEVYALVSRLVFLSICESIVGLVIQNTRAQVFLYCNLEEVAVKRFVGQNGELDGVCTSLDGPRCDPGEKARYLSKVRQYHICNGYFDPSRTDP